MVQCTPLCIFYPLQMQHNVSHGKQPQDENEKQNKRKQKSGTVQG